MTAIKIEFFPLTATTVLKPMDHGVKIFTSAVSYQSAAPYSTLLGQTEEVQCGLFSHKHHCQCVEGSVNGHNQ